MEKPLYTGYSVSGFTLAVTTRIGWLLALGYTVYHFPENPIVISIVAAVLTCFFMITGADEIRVYTDRITRTNDSFASKLFGTRIIAWEMRDIKKAFIPIKEPDKPEKDISVIGAAVVLSILTFSSRNYYGSPKGRFLWLELKNGKTVSISTVLTNETIKKITALVNSLV